MNWHKNSVWFRAPIHMLRTSSIQKNSPLRRQHLWLVINKNGQDVMFHHNRLTTYLLVPLLLDIILLLNSFRQLKQLEPHHHHHHFSIFCLTSLFFHRSSPVRLGTLKSWTAEDFLKAGCPFCHPTNSIKTLKEWHDTKLLLHEILKWLKYCHKAVIYVHATGTLTNDLFQPMIH